MERQIRRETVRHRETEKERERKEREKVIDRGRYQRLRDREMKNDVYADRVCVCVSRRGHGCYLQARHYMWETATHPL